MPNKSIGKIKYVNLSISAELDNKNIITGYRIEKDNYFYKEGKTLEGGYILEKVPLNSTYKIMSMNLENQSYYQISKIIIVNELKPYRATLDIVEPGKIEVSHILEKTNNRVLVEISSNGVYSNICYCIDWSAGFLYVKNYNHTLMNLSIPTYVKCYNTNKNLNNDYIIIILKYKEWKNLGENDSIRLFVFDSKEDNGIIFKDFGGKDVEYIIEGY